MTNCTIAVMVSLLFGGMALGAGSYELCVGMTSCANVTDNCLEILQGQSASLVFNLDGECGPDDSYDAYVRVQGDNSPGFECLPYTLKYSLTTGCF